MGRSTLAGTQADPGWVGQWSASKAPSPGTSPTIVPNKKLSFKLLKHPELIRFSGLPCLLRLQSISTPPRQSTGFSSLGLDYLPGFQTCSALGLAPSASKRSLRFPPGPAPRACSSSSLHRWLPKAQTSCLRKRIGKSRVCQPEAPL